MFDGTVPFQVWKSGGTVPHNCGSMSYTPNKPRRKSFGTKTKVEPLVDEATLGGNRSATGSKGGYVKLLHKLTSGLGSFSQ